MAEALEMDADVCAVEEDEDASRATVRNCVRIEQKKTTFS